MDKRLQLLAICRANAPATKNAATYCYTNFFLPLKTAAASANTFTYSQQFTE